MPNRIFLATLAFIIELYSRVDSSKKIQMNLILAPRTCTVGSTYKNVVAAALRAMFCHLSF